NNFITSSIQFGLRDRDADQDNLLTQSFLGNTLLSESMRFVNTTDRSNNLDVNLGYTHLYDKPQQELSILAQYSPNDSTNNIINSCLDAPRGTIAERFKNDHESFNEEITLQADYRSPLGTNQMVEFGARTILRNASSDYKYYT